MRYLILACIFLVFVTAKECNVMSYGAKGDGKNNDTEAILKAFEDCKGETVVFPNGTFLSWPLILSDGMTLELQAKSLIIMPDKVDAWPSDDVEYFMYGDDLKSLNITGSGTIDGRGDAWWEIRKYNSSQFAPRLIGCERCHNVLVSGITLQNSPQMHLALQRCQNCEVSNVKIVAPYDAPNTDGIDIGGQNNHVHDCYIDNGDDNIAIEASSDESNPTSNFLIEHNTFGHGHGTSIGSIMKGYVQNITVRYNTYNGTTNGARIKTFQGGVGWVRNVLYDNLKFVNVKNPLLITQYYCPSFQGICNNATSAVKISNVTFSNISGTQSNGHAGKFLCSDTVPCESINLINVDIEAFDPKDKDEFYCWSVHGTSTNVHPESCIKN